jgi:dTDP-glucose 4,6-dehydratase
MSPFAPRAILVTGGAGFIGSGFVDLAVQRGLRVIVLDALTYAGHRENLEAIRGPGSFELVVGDIRDQQRVQSLLRENQIDALVNFAAESHVDRSITGPAAFIETNIIGTYSLLAAALAHHKENPSRGFRYLQVSTDEVYGALGDSGKFSESTSYAPNSPYSASKASGDFLVRAWHHTYGLPTVTTNCSNNYGPRQYPEKLIPHMIQCALNGKDLPVYGKGENVRDWIHVEDHCAGVFLALERGKPGATYCFGGNAERKNIDVVKTICRELDRQRPRADGQSYEKQIAFVTDRLGHDWRYAIDDTLAQRELGFKRRYQFEDGLASTVRWYLDHDAWARAVLAKNAEKKA